MPYQNTFIFRSEIYNYAKELNYHIDEYTIRIEGEQIFKKYKTNFKTSKGDDEVFNLAFKKIYDSRQNLLAWLWIGVSHFKAVISKDCQMRGLRLRKENIQIGDDDALQKLFKEDRGHHYFIGEVFAVSKNLIPNYEGSAINSAYSKIDSYEKKEAELQEKKRKGDFVNDSHYESALADVERAKESAQRAADDIKKKKQKAANNSESDSAIVVNQVILRLENERKQRESTNTSKSSEKKRKSPESRRVDKLSAYSRNEKKLISKIFGIILTATDNKTAEMIIRKIEDGLQ